MPRFARQHFPQSTVQDCHLAPGKIKAAVSSGRSPGAARRQGQRQAAATSQALAAAKE